MVLQKRLDYGFNGYQVPPTPRAARSVRRRCLVRGNKVNDHQMCAFDLLANVAGKLLSEGENENSPPSVDTKEIVGKEENDKNTLPEEKSCYERNFLLTELVTEVPNSNFGSNISSGITTSGSSEKVNSGEQLVNDDCKLRLGIFDPTVEDESGKIVKEEPSDKKPIPFNSVDSVKFKFNKENNVKKLVTREDDDEDDNDDDNSSGCTAPSATRVKSFRPLDRRIRKPILSKPYVKNEERCNADGERRNFVDRKKGFKRFRPLRDYPFKKRKFYEFTSVSNGDCVPQNGFNGDSSMNGVIKTPTAAADERGSLHSRNPEVKLKIKSFRVPELVVEIPETATVGHLKRKVMEAVNAYLGSGLRIGVLFQGKKIRDDDRTLLQTGISGENKMENLGFTLEPGPDQAQIRMAREDRPSRFASDSPRPLARYPPAPGISQNVARKGSFDFSPEHCGNHFNNFVESDHDSAPSPPDMSLQITGSESKALVPVHAMKQQDALAVVPLRKLKRSESAQRRIRRPFTVSEVEALVQAVEKLGTGRWRDVKLRAFDSAKHRTYVDLKDKWKTLVHTARISPQQRRGEPVPQELLDRVLTAHAYWSQQQAKQQIKSHTETCLLL